MLLLFITLLHSAFHHLYVLDVAGTMLTEHYIWFLVCCREINMPSHVETAASVRDGRHEELRHSQKDSKLELFGFDSLVNILGLKRYLVVFSYLLFSYNTCSELNFALRSSAFVFFYVISVQNFKQCSWKLIMIYMFWFLVESLRMVDVHLLQYFNWLSHYSMTGEQIPTPSSPKDSEDASITVGRLKVYWLTLSPNDYCTCAPFN